MRSVPIASTLQRNSLSVAAEDCHLTPGALSVDPAHPSKIRQADRYVAVSPIDLHARKGHPCAALMVRMRRVALQASGIICVL
jgi:hypothetical protein